MGEKTDFEIESTENVNFKNWNALIYGKSGIGKTVACATAPDPMLILDTEGGVMSIAEKKKPFIRVKTWDQFRSIISKLTGGTLKDRDGNPFQPKTVVIDSISELQKLNMEWVLETSGREGKQPRIDDWGTNISMIRSAVRHLRDMNVNIILTALDKVEKDEETGEMSYKVALQGKISDEIPAFMDFVFYLNAKQRKDAEGNEETVRFFVTKADMRYIAKDRSDKLDRFEKPDFSAMAEKIEGA